MLSIVGKNETSSIILDIYVYHMKLSATPRFFIRRQMYIYILFHRAAPLGVTIPDL